jgi:UDP-N-acetylglucosamine 1-carboxyvinyltransferase
MMYAVINGGARPSGRVRVSGAKNSATRLLAAALLTDKSVFLGNFPTRLVDVGHKIRFCETIGASIAVDHAEGNVRIDASDLKDAQLTRDEYDVPIRTTYLLAAGQLARFGIARIPYPGGCPIGGGSSGARGYDLHMMVWRALGCDVTEKDDHIEIKGKQLLGGKIRFPISTVGGTENALLCASVAHGRTEILNAYITPEIEDLITFLRRMGAQIAVHGASHIVVEGSAGLLDGAHMHVMPDRIEALTWMVYGIVAGGEITVDNVPFSAMEVPLLHIAHAGVDLFRNSNSVHVTPECMPKGVQPFELACGAHPGIISDMQAFFVALAVVGSGTSRVFDYRYPERIAFVSELAKLVDDDVFEAERGKIVVHGKASFRPGVASSTDLRGSMAAVMAALCAEGRSVIHGVHMALRGYNNLAGKLQLLGADMSIYEDDVPLGDVA